MNPTKIVSVLACMFMLLGLVIGSSLAMPVQLVPNSPPSLSQIGDQEISEDETLVIPISASDPDGASLELSIDVLPEGASFMDNGDNTGRFTWTPDFDQAGEYSVTFRATDPSEEEEKITIVITVEN